MTPSTEADLRELSEKATPGRWRFVGRPGMLTAYIQSQHVRHPNANGSWADVASAVANNYDNEANAAFIVACVNYVRDMLASQDHAPSAGGVQDPAWKLVPVEPTEETTRIIFNWLMGDTEDLGGNWHGTSDQVELARDLYRTLIAASPPPPEGER